MEAAKPIENRGQLLVARAEGEGWRRAFGGIKPTAQDIERTENGCVSIRGTVLSSEAKQTSIIGKRKQSLKYWNGLNQISIGRNVCEELLRITLAYQYRLSHLMMQSYLGVSLRYRAG
jgi:hypothetical protein